MQGSRKHHPQAGTQTAELCRQAPMDSRGSAEPVMASEVRVLGHQRQACVDIPLHPSDQHRQPGPPIKTPAQSRKQPHSAHPEMRCSQQEPKPLETCPGPLQSHPSCMPESGSDSHLTCHQTAPQPSADNLPQQPSAVRPRGPPAREWSSMQEPPASSSPGRVTHSSGSHMPRSLRLWMQRRCERRQPDPRPQP